MKLSQPLRRTSYGQNCVSFLAPSAWNLPDELKRCTNLNMFKHKIKEYFFYKTRQKDNDIYFYDWTPVVTAADAFFFSNFIYLFIFDILPYISLPINDMIMTKYLWKDGIHLQDLGTSILSKNFIEFVNNYLFSNFDDRF